MRSAQIYWNGIFAGTLTETARNSYTFKYNDEYYYNSDYPAISLTINKSRQKHSANRLFPFFSNLLSEGVNRSIQNKLLNISDSDDFGLLIASATTDTIGAITVMADSP